MLPAFENPVIQTSNSDLSYPILTNYLTVVYPDVFHQFLNYCTGFYSLFVVQIRCLSNQFLMLKQSFLLTVGSCEINPALQCDTVIQKQQYVPCTHQLEVHTEGAQEAEAELSVVVRGAGDPTVSSFIDPAVCQGQRWSRRTRCCCQHHDPTRQNCPQRSGHSENEITKIV